MDKNKKNRLLLIIGIVLFLIIGIVEIILFSQSKKKSDYHNKYQISDNIVQEDNINIYTNDNLEKSHCLDSICIEDLKIYYYDNGGGRVEYSISNTSNNTVSGSIKLVFGKDSLIASYWNLEANHKVKTSSVYQDKKLREVNDYTLSKVMEEEKSRIIVIDK